VYGSTVVAVYVADSERPASIRVAMSVDTPSARRVREALLGWLA
jgi:hypothetical protein